MSDSLQPGGVARRVLLRRALGVGAGGVAAVFALQASYADDGSQVVIDSFAFLPSRLQVKSGTRVTWTNHDDIPHSIVCPALQVHSHPLDTNDSFSYTFGTVGEFTYLCGLHPFMHGMVVVTA